MNKREETIQKFSTFLSFQNKNNNRNLFWQTDPSLERRMRLIAESNLEAQADFWARYFLKIAKEITPISDIPIGENTSQFLLSSGMAEKHLSAYLQEACLWSAQTLHRKFIFLRHKYSLEEYFQIGNTSANPPTKILRNFNFEYSHTNIEGYAKTAIIRAVKNQIYQQDIEAKRTKFSDYSLLKDLSNKELKECLMSAGINQERINFYCIVCQCFNEIYQPTDGLPGRSLAKPNESQLQEIALYYNQRCNQLNLNTKIAATEEIQGMLKTCIQLAREYRTKRFVSLEDKDNNIIDFRANLLDIAIEQEERNEVYLLVYKLFTRFSETSQFMFKLWLGLNLTQTEIAMVLKNKYPEFQKQYQIARQLGKASKHLLSDFIQEWNQANPENLINDDKNMELIQESLINCLQLCCQKNLVSLLEQIQNKFNCEQTILIGANKNDSEVLNRLKPRESLQLAFQNELESVIHLDKNSLSIVKNKLSEFMENYFYTSKNQLL
jgi:hypothetical protein